MSTVSHLHIHKWVLLVKHINNIFVSTLIAFLSLVGIIIVIVHVFIILLNSMVHLTDLDYIFVYVFWCNG